MNSEITSAFDYALLSLVAYANIKTGDVLLSKLQSADWPDPLAKYFANKFTLVHSSVVDPWLGDGLPGMIEQSLLDIRNSGYQGMIFKDKNGQYILANRGTSDSLRRSI